VSEDDVPTTGGLRDRDVARLRASVREDPDDDLFGDRFEIVREAGSGGMGIVYEAVEQVTARRVAIKVITGMAGPNERARFSAEIEVIERLDHPAIVDYVAHGETSRGEPYLAMEWLVGESLTERLVREPLSIAEAAILGERIADALDHAHRAGVVHRDLKPSNIFLVDNKASEAHLIDFGVAKRAHSDLTHTGQMIGTPGYMAPEQVRGEKSVNASADLFALGCVLYKSLTGRDAFEGAEVMEILARLLLEDPQPIDALVRDLPPRFAHLINSLLSKHQASRLGDAAIACAELRAIRRALEDGDTAALALRPAAVPMPAPIKTAIASPSSRRGLVMAGVGVLVAGAIVMMLMRSSSASCTEDVRDGCEARCNDNDATACYLFARSLHGSSSAVQDHEAARVKDAKACRLGEDRGCAAAAKSLFAVAKNHAPDGVRASLLGEAEQLLAMGCDRGHAESCRSLGRALSRGQGPLPPDPARAFALVIRACERDDVAACKALLDMIADVANEGTAAMRDAARKAYAAACTRELHDLQCTR
jgi:hypothetical protein